MEYEQEVQVAQQRIESAIQRSQAYHMQETANWLAEMRRGMTKSAVTHEICSALDCIFPVVEHTEQQSDCSTFRLASIAFQRGEYRRCHALLGKHWRAYPTETTTKEMFLCCYALYHALQEDLTRKTNEEIEQHRFAGESSEKYRMPRSSIQASGSATTWGELMDSLKSIPSKSSYVLYLEAVVAHELSRPSQQVVQLLSDALTQNPYIWCSWKLLAAIMPSIEEFNTLGLKRSFPWECARCLVALRVEDADKAQATLKILAPIFPDAVPILSLRAKCAKLSGNISEASSLYESALTIDPFRLDDFIDYAEVLSLSKDKDALGALVLRAHAADPHSPITNILIGNFFATVQQHDKAIEYYHRALHRNPSSVDVWVLLGHEYNHVGNSDGAIFAFSRGGEVDPADHRPWYGLGCTYEAMCLEEFASKFLERAAKCRPSDGRLWFHLAEHYEKHERFSQCVHALEQAVGRENEMNAYIYAKIATLYEGKLADVHRAIRYYTKHLEVRQASTTTPSLRSIYKKLGAYYAREGLVRVQRARAGDGIRVTARCHLLKATEYISKYTAVCADEQAQDPAQAAARSEEEEMMRSVAANVASALESMAS